MNYNHFLSEIYKDVNSQLNLNEIDRELKTGYGRRYEEAKTKIILAAQNAIQKHLNTLSQEELQHLKEYIKLFVINNNTNAMKATYDEDGFVYTIIYTELKTCEQILEYSQRANAPHQEPAEMQ